MQGKNYRKIEPGQWRYATGGGRPILDFNEDDWIFVEEEETNQGYSSLIW